MLVEAKVNGLAIDMSSNSPVVFLTPDDPKKILPIWIGHFEAHAIMSELRGITSKRPMTHDLLQRVIKSIGGTIEKIAVTELKDQTFYAKIFLKSNDEVFEIDARPSDSIALALKAEAPIFVNDELFQERDVDEEESSETPEDSYDPEKLKERLRNIKPEDFGDYSLG